MKTILSWLKEAISTKGMGALDHYQISTDEIRAADGFITAGHPWEWPLGRDRIWVPRDELEKIINRMPQEPRLELNGEELVIKCGRFRGRVQILPNSNVDYSSLETEDWRPIPMHLLPMLAALRPFISANAVQQWAMSVALENGWAYATNNIVLAGGKCAGLDSINLLLPAWAIDFILKRSENLTHWTWNENHFGFRWRNGAWLKSLALIGQFPEKGADMIRRSARETPTQEITAEFREAVERIAELATDTLAVYADRIESRFGKATVEDGVVSEIPPNSEYSLWGASYLLPALRVATAWSPAMWPNATPWKGPLLSGYVAARRQ